MHEFRLCVCESLFRFVEYCQFVRDARLDYCYLDSVCVCVCVCLFVVIALGGTELHPLIGPQYFCSLTYTSTSSRQQWP